MSFTDEWFKELAEQRKKNQKQFKEGKGRKITSVGEVIEMAKQGKSVINKNWGQMPCAFLQNMQARLVYSVIQTGLYEYIPKSKREL